MVTHSRAHASVLSLWLPLIGCKVKRFFLYSKNGATTEEPRSNHGGSTKMIAGVLPVSTNLPLTRSPGVYDMYTWQYKSLTAKAGTSEENTG